jgi:Multimeric flavodoxin WrbA
MKILILNASPRKEGNTARILKKIAEGIVKEHAVDWVDVVRLSIKPCMGCFRCRPNKECALSEDDAQMIGRKINKADVLIVGTPVYWGNMAGTLKNFFDRNVTTFEDFSTGRFPKPCQKGKRAVIVAASAAPWPFNGKGAIKSVKRVLRGGGYRITGIINYGGTALHKEIPPKVLRKAKKLGNSL